MAVGTIIYGVRFARPHWTTVRIVSMSTTSSALGYLAGFPHKLFYHARFAWSLEDGAGFNQALQNINLRLGGSTPWPYGVPVKDDAFPVAIGNPRVRSSPPSGDEPSFNEDATWNTSSDTSSAPSQQPTATHSSSGRWDEIRAANSKSGTLSSWDLLRQAHERSRVQNQTESGSQEPEEPSDFDNKGDPTRPPSDEARFSAMLEAERRRSSQS